MFDFDNPREDIEMALWAAGVVMLGYVLVIILFGAPLSVAVWASEVRGPVHGVAVGLMLYSGIGGLLIWLAGPH